MNKEKQIALMTVMFNYAEISRNQDVGISKEFSRLIARLCKKYQKIRRKISLTERESKTAEKFFNKFIDIDVKEFEDRDFSAFIMTILMLDYFMNEEINISIKNEFMDIKTLDTISELEKSHLSKETFFHHRVLTKMIEVKI